jgi:hypothetical protein
MKNGIRPQTETGTQALPQHVLVPVVGYFAVHEVREFASVGHVIDHDDVAHAAAVQPAHEIAADETGAAGNDYHELTTYPSRSTLPHTARDTAQPSAMVDSPVRACDWLPPWLRAAPGWHTT